MTTDAKKAALRRTVNRLHVGGNLVAAILSILSLSFSFPELVPLLLVIAGNIYMLVITIECALRSGDQGGQKKLLHIPSREWSLLAAAFLLVTLVTAFGDLYVNSESVKKSSEPPATLSEPFEAVYFSAVTITTLGYGEFTPTETWSRFLVLWQLASGLVLIVVIFSIVAARMSGF